MDIPARRTVAASLLVLTAVAVAGCGADRDGIRLVAQGPIWCYRTLAEPDCYAAPQPGEAGRLVAVPSGWSWAAVPASSR